MLPRRSAVIKYAFCLSVSLAVIFLYATGPFSSGSSPWRHVLREIQTYGLNETKLRTELGKLTVELNMTYNAQNKSLLELYRVVQAMRDKVPVNPHNYELVLNPAKQVCNDDLFLLVYVHTAPAHYKRRAAIRDSWGNTHNIQDLNIKVVFLLGRSTDQALDEAIAFESDMYGDIVQEAFIDSYRNLTYKAIMGLKWVSFHCLTAKFVLKVDDDIFVNMFNVINHLQTLQKYEESQHVQGLLLCLVWYRMKVVRDPKSKWYLSKSEFAHDYFPTYCSGSAFVMTTDVIKSMYNASQFTPFFWVDDFYVTGLLAQKVGVVHKKFNSVYSLGPSTFMDKFSDETKWRTYTFGHVHSLNNMITVWRKVVDDRENAKIKEKASKLRVFGLH